jgi:hypothetical protein
MRSLYVIKIIILSTSTIVGAANAAGIPERVADLEKKAADLQQQISTLQAGIREVDQNAGLVRSSTQQYVWNGNALSPQLQHFSGRTLLVAVIVPVGAGVPGNGAFAVGQGASVKYFDCGQFEVSASGLTVSGAFGGTGCPSNAFTVTYLYTGPKL